MANSKTDKDGLDGLPDGKITYNKALDAILPCPSFEDLEAFAKDNLETWSGGTPEFSPRTYAKFKPSSQEGVQTRTFMKISHVIGKYFRKELRVALTYGVIASNQSALSLATRQQIAGGDCDSRIPRFTSIAELQKHYADFDSPALDPAQIEIPSPQQLENAEPLEPVAASPVAVESKADLNQPAYIQKVAIPSRQSRFRQMSVIAACSIALFFAGWNFWKLPTVPLSPVPEPWSSLRVARFSTILELKRDIDALSPQPTKLLLAGSVADAEATLGRASVSADLNAVDKTLRQIRAKLLYLDGKFQGAIDLLADDASFEAVEIRYQTLCRLGNRDDAIKVLANCKDPSVYADVLRQQSFLLERDLKNDWTQQGLQQAIFDSGELRRRLGYMTTPKSKLSLMDVCANERVLISIWLDHYSGPKEELDARVFGTTDNGGRPSPEKVIALMQERLDALYAQREQLKTELLKSGFELHERMAIGDADGLSRSLMALWNACGVIPDEPKRSQRRSELKNAIATNDRLLMEKCLDFWHTHGAKGLGEAVGYMSDIAARYFDTEQYDVALKIADQTKSLLRDTPEAAQHVMTNYARILELVEVLSFIRVTKGRLEAATEPIVLAEHELVRLSDSALAVVEKRTYEAVEPFLDDAYSMLLIARYLIKDESLLSKIDTGIPKIATATRGNLPEWISKAVGVDRAQCEQMHQKLTASQ